MVYINGSMCPPRLGTVLAIYLHEAVITLFIASPVARGGIGDPTTMLARGAVVVEAARTMGISAQEHVYWCQSTSSTII
jgi:hypothetical protein